MHQGIAWVTGRGRHVRLRRVGPAQPGAALPLRSVDRQHRRRSAGPGRLGSARLPAPQHAAHSISMASGRGRACSSITEEDYAKPTCEGQGSVQTWRITDELNPDGTIKLELLDMWTTELNELVEPDGPLAGDRQLLGALVRRATATSSPRAGTTRACASWTSPTRATSSQVGYYATAGHVLGRVLRADDATDGLRARHGLGHRRAALRPHDARRGGCRSSTARPAQGPAVRVPSSRWGFACPLPRLV